MKVELLIIWGLVNFIAGVLLRGQNTEEVNYFL